jgi:hypothetical protein
MLFSGHCFDIDVDMVIGLAFGFRFSVWGFRFGVLGLCWNSFSLHIEKQDRGVLEYLVIWNKYPQGTVNVASCDAQVR